MQFSACEVMFEKMFGFGINSVCLFTRLRDINGGDIEGGDIEGGDIEGGNINKSVRMRAGKTSDLAFHSSPVAFLSFRLARWFSSKRNFSEAASSIKTK